MLQQNRPEWTKFQSCQAIKVKIYASLRTGEHIRVYGVVKTMG